MCVVVTVVVVVVVTGALSGSVVVGAVADTGCRCKFFPSAPLLGSGDAFGMPCAVGVPDDVVTGCLIAGGSF